MYSVIVNPISGHGLSLKYLPEIESLLKTKHFEYRVLITTRPKEASDLAAQACLDLNCEGIISVGGDGTLFEIVNGMKESTVPLIFVPCGTGNDFIKTLKLPKEPIESLRVQLDAPVSKIDIGKVNDIYFLNVSGTGFDVDVLNEAEKYKAKYTGLKTYFYGLVDAVKAYKPKHARILIDGGIEKEIGFAILSFGNGRYFGGGMKAVPKALVNDGLLDVMIVKPVKKIAVLPLILFFITGTHLNLKIAELVRCKRVQLSCSQAFTMNLDGELIEMDRADVQILSGALSVRIPNLH